MAITSKSGWIGWLGWCAREAVEAVVVVFVSLTVYGRLEGPVGARLWVGSFLD